MQCAARSPFGLGDRLVWAARDLPGRSQAYVQAGPEQVGDPEVAAVPGQVRVVPGDPGELPPVAAGAGEGVEIVSFVHGTRWCGAVEGQHDEIIWPAGPFPDTDQRRGVQGS